MSANLRRLKHENVTAKFDANRGAEGQIKARKNAKGEVELVAFFGGKWFYCPMAEFNQTLNLRHGAQVNGSDIMTASQKDSSGFTSIRLAATSAELGPKLNECKMFVDTVAATGSTSIGACNMVHDKSESGWTDDAAPNEVRTYLAAGNANIKVGLNVTGTNIQAGSYITGIESSGGTGPKIFHISRPVTGKNVASGVALSVQTLHTSYPNAFLNVMYKDGNDTYYHKFQLNTTVLTPFTADTLQDTYAGSVSGVGGSGFNLVL